VYVCQHNGWAISQPATSYLPAPIVERAAGYGIPGVCIDGNDLDAVRSAVSEAVGRARAGDGPTLIEARTWRLRGHWAGDTQAYRTGPEPENLEDPLDLFAYRLLEHGLATEANLTAIHAEVQADIQQAIERAQAAPDAESSDLGLEDVYA
jgi:pyruvate dehydrogenase E1 component alpha subunit